MSILGLVRNVLRVRPLAAGLAAALTAAPLSTGWSADLPVTSCADDGSPGTLRSMVYSAHDGDVVDLTQLTCSSITLTKGPIDSSLLGNYPIRELTLNGPGRDALTISGGDVSLVFHATGKNGAGRLTLNDLTGAQGGNAGARDAEGPWCIYGSTIELNRVTLTDCHSTFAGGFDGGGAVGAGVLYMTDSVIRRSSIVASGNHFAGGGGAWVGGTATLVNSTISGNQASAQVGVDKYDEYAGGGGLYVDGNLTLINSTISGNSVEATDTGENARGGGVFVRGTATIIGSTIEGNIADGDGGGLFKTRAFPFYDSTTATIQDSTVSGNHAGGAGGGLASQRGVTLANSTVAFNDSSLGGGVMFRPINLPYNPGAGTLDLQSTILAGNTTGAGAPYAADLGADDTLTVTGANALVMAADSAIVLPPDTLQVDPQLLPLAWNGGPTQTLALVAGSPAIDAGNNVADLATDQRSDGFPRISGPAADIGAFEFQQALLAPRLAKAFAPPRIAPGGTSTLTITLTNDNTGVATLSADLVDALPSPLVVADVPDAATTCAGGTVAADPGAGAVVLGTAAAIPATASCTVTVSVTADVDDLYANTIPVGALQTDLGSSAEAATAVLAVSDAPDVSKTFMPDAIQAGASAILTIRLDNGNPMTATLLSPLADALPAPVTVADPANAATTCPGGVVGATSGSHAVTLATGATIPPSSTCTVTVAVTADAQGTFTNTLPAGTLHTDLGTDTAPASADLTVTTAPPSLAKAFTPAEIAAGSRSTLTITLGNANATPAILAADLVDALPSPLVVANPPNAATTCPGGTVGAATGATRVSLDAGTRIGGMSACTVVVAVTTGNAGSYTNTIPAGALQTNFGDNGTAASAVLTVDPVTIADPIFADGFDGALR